MQYNFKQPCASRCVLLLSYFVSHRHVGDLGNVIAGENGVAKIDIVDKMLTLSGQHSIIGRTMVVRKHLCGFKSAAHLLAITVCSTLDFVYFLCRSMRRRMTWVREPMTKVLKLATLEVVWPVVL